MTATFPDPTVDEAPAPESRTAVLAGGCFWCTEAVFEIMEGVTDVTSVYTGGSKETANYDAVCSGRSGHAEAIKITYDASKTTYGQLLKIFFSVAHDPTQLNRQGHDVGTQYRSAIFYSSDQQRNIADAYVRQLNEARVFSDPIVTQIAPLGEVYVAETYHQDYAEQNQHNPYIVGVSNPKVAKLRKNYPTCVRRQK